MDMYNIPRCMFDDTYIYIYIYIFACVCIYIYIYLYVQIYIHNIHALIGIRLYHCPKTHINIPREQNTGHTIRHHIPKL